MVRPWSFTGSEHSAHTLSRGIHVTLMSHTGLAATIVPGFSKLPVKAMRSKQAMPVMKPSEVWSMATPHCRQAFLARPSAQAASTIRSASTPQVSAANSGVYLATFSLNSSYP